MPSRNRLWNTPAINGRSAAAPVSFSITDASVTICNSVSPAALRRAVRSAACWRKRVSMVRTISTGGVASANAYVSGNRKPSTPLAGSVNSSSSAGSCMAQRNTSRPP